jgi:uncharacterized protein (TIGR00369 family)
VPRPPRRLQDFPGVADWVERSREWHSRGMWRNLNGRVEEEAPGRVVVHADLSADAHGFPTGRGWIVHGGAVSALADCALASAAASLMAPGEVPTTASLSVDFYRPAQPGHFIARAEARHRARRLCYCQATLEQEDGQVVAEARAVMYFVTPAQ